MIGLCVTSAVLDSAGKYKDRQYVICCKIQQWGFRLKCPVSQLPQQSVRCMENIHRMYLKLPNIMTDYVCSTIQQPTFIHAQLYISCSISYPSPNHPVDFHSSLWLISTYVISTLSDNPCLFSFPPMTAAHTLFKSGSRRFSVV